MQEGTAEAFAVQPAEASQESIVDKPAVGEHSTSQLGESRSLQMLLHSCNNFAGPAQCSV